MLGSTLRAFANSRKDDWDARLPYAVFAINKAASTLGGVLHGPRPSWASGWASGACRCPSPTCGPPENHGRPTCLGQRRGSRRSLEVWAPLHVAQQELKAALDPSRVDKTFQVGLRSCSTPPRRASCDCCSPVQGARALHSSGARRPKHVYSDPAAAVPHRFECSPAVNVDRPKPRYSLSARPT